MNLNYFSLFLEQLTVLKIISDNKDRYIKLAIKDGRCINAIIFVGAPGSAGAMCYIFWQGKAERIEVNKFDQVPHY